MIGLKYIDPLMQSITLFIAYLLAVSPAGCFRAWVAKKMGDNTAECLGFLTLNPLVHVDLFGLVWLFIYGQTQRIPSPFGRPLAVYTSFGWGKFVPIDASNIVGRHRSLKLFFAVFSDAFLYFFFGIFSYIIYAIVYANMAFSPAQTVVIQVSLAFFNLSTWLLVLGVVINALSLLWWSTAQGRAMDPYWYYGILLGPIFLIILFGEIIWSSMTGLIIFFAGQLLTLL